MRDVIESLPHPVVVLSTALDIALVNREARAALGAEASEAIGHCITEWMDQDSGAAVKRMAEAYNHAQSLASPQRDPDSVRVTILHQAGGRKTYAARIRPVGRRGGGQSASGKSSWFAVTLIRSALESSSTASDAREDVLAFVTHEVRNALAPVGLALEDLLATVELHPGASLRLGSGRSTPPRVSRSSPISTSVEVRANSEAPEEGEKVSADAGTLRLLKRSTTTAMDILNGVLDIERLHQGHGLMTSWFPVCDMVEQAREAACVLGASSGISVGLHIDKRLACVELDGSELKLAQCIANFASNSVKLTSSGGSLTIYVSLQEGDPDGVLSLAQSAKGATDASASAATATRAPKPIDRVSVSAGSDTLGEEEPLATRLIYSNNTKSQECAGTGPLPQAASAPLTLEGRAATGNGPRGEAPQRQCSGYSSSGTIEGSSAAGVATDGTLSSIGTPSHRSGATLSSSAPFGAGALAGVPILPPRGPPSLAASRSNAGTGGPRLSSVAPCQPLPHASLQGAQQSAQSTHGYEAHSRHGGPTAGGLHRSAWEATEGGSAGRGGDQAPGAAADAEDAEESDQLTPLASTVPVGVAAAAVAAPAGSAAASGPSAGPAPGSTPECDAGQRASGRTPKGNDAISGSRGDDGSGGGAVSESAAWLRKCWIRIGLRDSGPGVDTADRCHLFQPFAQLRDRSSAAGLGTGLGLAFVREVAEKGHGGRVGIASPRLHAGADFFILLPGARARLTNAWGTYPLPPEAGDSADGKCRGVWRSEDSPERSADGTTSTPAPSESGDPRATDGAATERAQSATKPPSRDEARTLPATSREGASDWRFSSLGARSESREDRTQGSNSVGDLSSDHAREASGMAGDSRSSASQELQGSRVLIVDDSPLTRRLLAQTLRQRGLEVHTASRGEQALEAMNSAKAAEEPIHCLVTDWHMPGSRLQGRALVHEARVHHPDTVVIVISGADSAASADAHACLTKPVGANVLYASIRRNVLRMRRKKADGSESSQ